ncbi:hypothetical protein KIN20_001258, partial [Parelaphostrongylus tenuis]
MYRDPIDVLKLRKDQSDALFSKLEYKFHRKEDHRSIVMTLKAVLDVDEVPALLDLPRETIGGIYTLWRVVVPSIFEAPYLFSQCQPIHARSTMPCMDTPSVKSSYDAK